MIPNLGRTPANEPMPAADVIAAFIGAMEAAGLKPREPIAAKLGTGLVRFRADGDGPGRQNAWAVLHLDGRPAGAFGSYRLGISERWRCDAAAERLSRAERIERGRQYREQQEQRAAELLAQHQATADACRDRWERAAVVDPTHAYLTRKRIIGEALRQEGHRLLVPMLDGDGALWNLQSIDPEGVKRFAKGGRQAGLHLLVGNVGDSVVVGEGYGTVAVIRRATGLPVAVAFSAKNLTATALAMRDRFPSAEIVIAADDDAHLVNHPVIQRNLGLEAAHAPAQAVGGRVAIPPRRAA